jgi:hypothetical protein
MKTMKDVLDLIQMYSTPLTKTRVGHPHDGGYILLKELCNSIKRVYSFGVEQDATFDSDYSLRYDAFIRMFDHTVNGIPFQGERKADKRIQASFIKKGIGPERTDTLDTLENFVEGFNEFDTRKILKMDVEGAEWESLKHTPDPILNSFDMICAEFHDFQLLSSGDALNHQGNTLQRKGPNQHDIDVRYDALEKLTDSFYLFHAHPNNGFPVQQIDGFSVAPIVEMSFVRKDLVLATPTQWDYTALDAPNNHNLPDIMLDFWPFVRNE